MGKKCFCMTRGEWGVTQKVILHDVGGGIIQKVILQQFDCIFTDLFFKGQSPADYIIVSGWGEMETDFHFCGVALLSRTLAMLTPSLCNIHTFSQSQPNYYTLSETIMFSSAVFEGTNLWSQSEVLIKQSISSQGSTSHDSKVPLSMS